MSLKSNLSLSLALGIAISAGTSNAGSKETQCPDFLNHEFRKLHSQKKVNLCEKYNNKPIVVVNTASHCGYTKQFGDLEKLYQKYKKDGVEVIGFASNDFNQAAKSEEKAANICYKNYGVTFTMLAPSKIKGSEANPVFTHLGKHAKSPSWNFNKYVISNNGIEHFGSSTKPLDSDLEKALVTALN